MPIVFEAIFWAVFAVIVLHALWMLKVLLDRYLGEFATGVRDCKVKVEKVR